MEITPWLIYGVTRLDSISCFIGALVFASAVLSVVGLGMFIALETEGNTTTEFSNCAKVWKKASIKFFFPTLILCGFFQILLPSTREMAAILIIPVVTDSDIVNGLGSDLVILAEEWVEELKPNKDNK